MKATGGLLLLLALVAGVAAPAAAWGNRVVIINGAPTVVTTPPSAVHYPRPYYYAPYYSVPFYYKPPYVSYTAPPAWVPGYWSYQWAPQSYTTYIWVHPYRSVDGRFIEGHYEPRVVQTGAYQRVWVDGYWTR